MRQNHPEWKLLVLITVWFASLNNTFRSFASFKFSQSPGGAKVIFWMGRDGYGLHLEEFNRRSYPHGGETSAADLEESMQIRNWGTFSKHALFSNWMMQINKKAPPGAQYDKPPVFLINLRWVVRGRELSFFSSFPSRLDLAKSLWDKNRFPAFD